MISNHFIPVTSYAVFFALYLFLKPCLHIGNESFIYSLNPFKHQFGKFELLLMPFPMYVTFHKLSWENFDQHFSLISQLNCLVFPVDHKGRIPLENNYFISNNFNIFCFVYDTSSSQLKYWLSQSILLAAILKSTKPHDFAQYVCVCGNGRGS